MHKFDEYKAEDLAAWRAAHPVSADFVSWLEYSQDRARRNIALYVSQGNFHAASLAAGSLNCLVAIHDDLMRTDAKSTPPDDGPEFTDPAMPEAEIRKAKPNERENQGRRKANP